MADTNLTFKSALRKADAVVMWVHLAGSGCRVSVSKAAIPRSDLHEDAPVGVHEPLTSYNVGWEGRDEGRLIWAFDGQTLHIG